MINHSNYSNKFDNQRVMWLGTPGTWNLFGINLPDFGFTEAFGSSKPGGGGGSIFQNPKIRYSSPPKTSTQSFPKPPPSYTPPSVLGTSTSTGETGGTTDTSGGGTTDSGGDGGQPQEDPYAQIKSDISNAWDQYLSSLGGQSDFFNQQKTAQEGIANTQLAEGQRIAGEQKERSLRDIAGTTRRAFQAGNNYLGSLGAGDSSAANQYTFAINQQAQKQTGDLNNFVSSQLQTLQSQHDTQINQIATWFSQQQEALKQQIAQGGLQKGQDLANISRGILDQAMQATNALKTNTQNQYNALVSWAANNSTNLGQLQQNIAGVNSQFAPGQVSTVGGRNVQPLYGGAAQKRWDPNTQQWV